MQGLSNPARVLSFQYRVVALDKRTEETSAIGGEKEASLLFPNGQILMTNDYRSIPFAVKIFFSVFAL